MEFTDNAMATILICSYLGLNNKSECLTYQSEISQVQNKIEKLIQLNNLKYE